MTKFKQFAKQLAVILAATTAYPTLSQELPVVNTTALIMAADQSVIIEMTPQDFSVAQQVKETLSVEHQKISATSLVARLKEEKGSEEPGSRSE